jgi:4-methyl-5(b-hydroxyethyl)-thiazole monophosphate biosynthesis
VVYIYMADGFEEVEAITVADLLSRGGIPVETVSVVKREEVTGAHGIRVIADILYEDADHEKCEMIVLPGGGDGARRLLAHESVERQLADFAGKGKWIAAICAAPMILSRHGLLAGREATIYRGMEAELKDARYRDEDVVVSGNIITSRGPGTAMSFSLKLIEILRGEKTAAQVKDRLLIS